MKNCPWGGSPFFRPLAIVIDVALAVAVAVVLAAAFETIAALVAPPSSLSRRCFADLSSTFGPGRPFLAFGL